MRAVRRPDPYILLPGRAFIQLAVTKAICQSAIPLLRSLGSRRATGVAQNGWGGTVARQGGRPKGREGIGRTGEAGDAINDGSSLTQILQLNLGTSPPPRMLCASSECQIDFLHPLSWRRVRFLRFVFRRTNKYDKHDRRNDSGGKKASESRPPTPQS